MAQLRLGSLAYLDTQRGAVLARQRAPRVSAGDTLSALLRSSAAPKHAPSADLDLAADALVLVGTGGEAGGVGGDSDAVVPAKGAAVRLGLSDLNCSVDGLWRAAVGGDGVWRSAGVEVLFERALRGGGGGWRVVAAAGGALGLGQGDLFRVRVRSAGVVAVRIGFAGRDLCTGASWAAGVLEQGAYYVCGGGGGGGGGAGDGELVVGGEELVADGLAAGGPGGRGFGPGRRLVVEVYPVREFEAWLPKERRMMHGAAMHRTPRMLGMGAGDVLVFFGDALGRRARELTLEELGVRAKDDVVLRVSRRCFLRVRVPGEGGTVEVSVDVEFDTVADVKRRAGGGGGRMVFAGRVLDDAHLMGACGVYDQCEVHLVRGAAASGAAASGAVAAPAATAAAAAAPAAPAAGGHDVGRFCFGLMESATVDVLNCVQFAAATGRRMPPSPATREAYAAADVPWRDEYDGDAAAAEAVADALAARAGGGGLLLGAARTREPEPEAAAEEVRCCDCCRGGVAATKLTPCGHVLCGACDAGMLVLGYTPKGGTDMLACAVCDTHVFRDAKQVRFDGGEEDSEEEEEAARGSDSSSTGTVVIASSGSDEVAAMKRRNRARMRRRGKRDGRAEKDDAEKKAVKFGCLW